MPRPAKVRARRKAKPAITVELPSNGAPLVIPNRAFDEALVRLATRGYFGPVDVIFDGRVVTTFQIARELRRIENNLRSRLSEEDDDDEDDGFLT